MTPAETEQHRRDCLARHVLAKPFDERKPWIEDFERRNGQAAADQLRADVRRVHGEKR